MVRRLRETWIINELIPRIIYFLWPRFPPATGWNHLFVGVFFFCHPMKLMVFVKLKGSDFPNFRRFFFTTNISETTTYILNQNLWLLKIQIDRFGHCVYHMVPPLQQPSSTCHIFQHPFLLMPSVAKRMCPLSTQVLAQDPPRSSRTKATVVALSWASSHNGLRLLYTTCTLIQHTFPRCWTEVTLLPMTKKKTSKTNTWPPTPPIKRIPSRKKSHIPPEEIENHRLKYVIFWGIC